MRVLALAALLWTGVACDDTVFPARTHGTGATYAPTWDGTTAFMADNCEACHSGSAGTTPTMPDAIAADITAGTGRFVVPGDASRSLLWQMLDPTTVPAGEPGVMPFGSAGLPSSTIAPIQQWIDAGASLASSDTGNADTGP